MRAGVEDGVGERIALNHCDMGNEINEMLADGIETKACVCVYSGPSCRKRELESVRDGV